ncbi:hypothetical protein I3843_01G245400 [Carya illinoinensis]|nr:hypothetical protein I3843_01G245400 [Carya illinoinensis]
MALLIQPLFGNILYSFSSCSRTFPIHLLQPQLEEPVLKITRNSRFQTTQQRAYISDMRNSAFEGHILKTPPQRDPKFGDEDIKVEITMFDEAIPASKSGGGGSTMVWGPASHNVCSAWPDSIEINRLYLSRGDKMPVQPYSNPEFKNMSLSLQDALYEFLEARVINDELAAFFHEYVENKDKTEFIRWMGTMKSFLACQGK